ncbi:MAG: hypothetical protein V4764_01185 [Burkholderia sp.]
MNLRDHHRLIAMTERQRPSSPPTSSWLMRHTAFREALQRAETDFGTLPEHVRAPALKRMGWAEPVPAARFGAVRAAYVELSTASVVDSVGRYLTAGMWCDDLEGHRVAIHEAVAAPAAPAALPLARTPCLLGTGSSIFLDCWSRFFVYWSRGDATIPLLAVDWPTLYARMAAVEPPLHHAMPGFDRGLHNPGSVLEH